MYWNYHFLRLTSRKSKNYSLANYDDELLHKEPRLSHILIKLNKIEILATMAIMSPDFDPLTPPQPWSPPKGIARAKSCAEDIAVRPV